MKNCLFKKFQSLQPPLSIILILHLHILILQLILVPFSSDVVAKSPGEDQIIQQIEFGFNTGWIQTRQYSPDPVVKIGSFYQTTPVQVSNLHISTLFNDFPKNNPPEYQQHLIYTLITSSDM